MNNKNSRNRFSLRYVICSVNRKYDALQLMSSFMIALLVKFLRLEWSNLRRWLLCVHDMKFHMRQDPCYHRRHMNDSTKVMRKATIDVVRDLKFIWFDEKKLA